MAKEGGGRQRKAKEGKGSECLTTVESRLMFLDLFLLPTLVSIINHINHTQREFWKGCELPASQCKDCGEIHGGTANGQRGV